jgi:hypothetical protein
LHWKKLKDLVVSSLFPLLISAAGFLFLIPCLKTMQRNMLKTRSRTCCEMAASYNGRIDWQSNQPKPIEETNMITKRPSQNTTSLVLFIAAMLVIFSAAFASRFIPANLPGSAIDQKLPQGQTVSNFDAYDYYMRQPQGQTASNFDAFDYYMTHPKIQNASNFDAFDYYMRHAQAQTASNFDAFDYYMRQPQAQTATNFDAFDYYMRHPQAQTVTNFDAFDYYMTHPKLINH